MASRGNRQHPLTSLKLPGWDSVLGFSSGGSPLLAASLGGERAESSLQAKELSAGQPV